MSPPRSADYPPSIGWVDDCGEGAGTSTGAAGVASDFEVATTKGAAAAAT